MNSSPENPQNIEPSPDESHLYESHPTTEIDVIEEHVEESRTVLSGLRDAINRRRLGKIEEELEELGDPRELDLRTVSKNDAHRRKIGRMNVVNARIAIAGHAKKDNKGTGKVIPGTINGSERRQKYEQFEGKITKELKKIVTIDDHRNKVAEKRSKLEAARNDLRKKLNIQETAEPHTDEHEKVDNTPVISIKKSNENVTVIPSSEKSYVSALLEIWKANNPVVTKQLLATLLGELGTSEEERRLTNFTFQRLQNNSVIDEDGKLKKGRQGIVEVLESLGYDVEFSDIRTDWKVLGAEDKEADNVALHPVVSRDRRNDGEPERYEKVATFIESADSKAMEIAEIAANKGFITLSAIQRTLSDRRHQATPLDAAKVLSYLQDHQILVPTDRPGVWKAGITKEEFGLIIEDTIESSTKNPRENSKKTAERERKFIPHSGIELADLDIITSQIKSELDTLLPNYRDNNADEEEKFTTGDGKTLLKSEVVKKLSDPIINKYISALIESNTELQSSNEDEFTDRLNDIRRDYFRYLSFKNPKPKKS